MFRWIGKRNSAARRHRSICWSENLRNPAAGRTLRIDVAAAIDVRPEQLREFETGAERVPAAVLLRLSKLFQFDVLEFFRGLPPKERSPGASVAIVSETTEAAEAAALLHDFSRIRDQRARRVILSLVAGYAENRDAYREIVGRLTVWPAEFRKIKLGVCASVSQAPPNFANINLLMNDTIASGAEMLKEAKSLIELASIDLAYAQLEIACADGSSKMLDHIGFHLNEVSRRLSELTQSVNAAELSKKTSPSPKCEQLNCDVATLPRAVLLQG